VTQEAPRRAAPTREALHAALSRSGGNVARTARELGLHRTQLRRWLEKYDIDPRSFGAGGEEPQE
jgi:transcriptional regulator with GAF, ATPase, and Fis domain